MAVSRIVLRPKQRVQNKRPLSRAATVPPSGGGITANVALQELPDAMAISAAVTFSISASIAATEIQDSLAASATVTFSISASVAAVEIQDNLAASATVAGAITASVAATEVQDRFAATVTNGGAELIDVGKKTKKANKARDKALKEERERRERRRQEVIDAFEQTFEGKVTLPEGVAEEMVNTIEARQENNPKGPDFEAILANLTNVEALWLEYLDRDDEEVLVLL